MAQSRKNLHVSEDVIYSNSDSGKIQREIPDPDIDGAKMWHWQWGEKENYQNNKTTGTSSF